MKEDLKRALNDIELVYEDIKEITDSLVKTYTEDITKVIDYIGNNLENLTNEDLRMLILKLSAKAYSFGDIKEKAGVKAEIAEMLKKEKYATEFGLASGSVAAKDNISLLKTSNEIVAQAIYDLVASLYKVKLDEIRRMIDSLKIVLTSRLSEAKLSGAFSENIGEKENG